MKQLFDQEIRNEICKENILVPEHIHKRTEALLESLPEKESNRTKIHIIYKPIRRIASVAACVLFVMLVVLPNVSVTYAYAMEKIPVIGDLVEIFTIRNYFYSDSNHELDANIPNVNDPYNEQVSNLINKDVNDLTEAIIQRFYGELEISHDVGYGSIYIDYETVTNTENWFTLKLTVSEVQASSNTYFKVYHINRNNGSYVHFNDLFEEKDYDAIEKLIREQMEREMQEDSNVIYWLEDNKQGERVTKLSNDQNFYFDEFGNLVIVYNEYEVAPGSMGCPEIVINKESIQKYIQLHYETDK